ncbi:hypothetical protein RCL_jg18940.t1 [Rhizophagus clarus]|uniref:Uncharacterized protein n=1 Tax=Rhizophagus clarus TaxID=94130 RepID=A0A8H3MAS1_9GLOM|nr:hypothetical protein RCL_jg18940.t1 [Rhizophagus clarus]
MQESSDARRIGERGAGDDARSFMATSSSYDSLTKGRQGGAETLGGLLKRKSTFNSTLFMRVTSWVMIALRREGLNPRGKKSHTACANYSEWETRRNHVAWEDEGQQLYSTVIVENTEKLVCFWSLNDDWSCYEIQMDQCL